MSLDSLLVTCSIKAVLGSRKSPLFMGTKAMPQPLRAAVIGAGVSGLNCARHLAQSGWDVDVYEKSRGVGGRLATKRIEQIGTVDLGAQFMTARTPELAQLFRLAEAAKTAATWHGRIAYLSAAGTQAAREETRWIGIPGMNAWLAHVWPRERIYCNRRVETLKRQADGLWRLDDDTKGYHCLVLALPPAQALALAPEASFRASLQKLEMRPCWAALALFESPLAVDFDAAFVRLGGLDWICANHSKSARTQHPAAWTLHAGPELSRELLDAPPEIVGQRLLEHLRLALAPLQDIPVCQIALVHRWRYAAPTEDKGPGVFWDAAQALAACGDWSMGGRVEGAFTSGRELADIIAREFSRQ